MKWLSKLMLRWRIATARLDGQIIEAEMLSAPARLSNIRVFINNLEGQLTKLGG